MSKINEGDEINKGLKLLVKSSFVVFIGLFLSKILTYIYRILIARQFGPEVYGLFSLALVVVGWFIAIFSFGIVDGILRYFPHYRGGKELGKISYVSGLSMKILLFSGIFSGILLFYFSSLISMNIFHNPSLEIFLKIFAILIPFWIFSNFFISILRAYEEIGLYSFIINILQNIAKVFFLIFFIFLYFNSNAVIFSHFLGIFLIFVVSLFVCKKKFPEIFSSHKISKNEKLRVRKSFLSYSLPLMFTGIISSLFYWIDSFCIGYFKDATQVGFYNAAVPIVLLMMFVPELFTQLFFPLINREFASRNIETVKQLSKQVGKWIFIFNLPLLFIFILFPGAIINVLFDSEYLIAGNALRILSIGYFFSSLFYLSNNLLAMTGRSKLLLIDLAITTILNLILNIFLVPRLGIDGAAISTTIVWVLLSFSWFFQSRYFTKIIPLRRKMVKIFFVSLVPLFLLIFLKQIVEINLLSMALLGSLFILTYVLLIFITGCLDRNDTMILKSLKEKLNLKFS
jgi:stage V sporulation protein B